MTDEHNTNPEAGTDTQDRLDALVSCPYCIFEVFGWVFWDKDDPKGFDHAIFVWGRKSPKTETQDRNGHHWDAFPLYRKAGCTGNCNDAQHRVG